MKPCLQILKNQNWGTIYRKCLVSNLALFQYAYHHQINSGKLSSQNYHRFLPQNAMDRQPSKCTLCTQHFYSEWVFSQQLKDLISFFRRYFLGPQGASCLQLALSSITLLPCRVALLWPDWRGKIKWESFNTNSGSFHCSICTFLRISMHLFSAEIIVWKSISSR